MDGSQFDAWTRRGFGVAAGGLAGSLLTRAAPGAEAKKGKKKKKKCGKQDDSCNSGKKKCCCGYECQEAGMGGEKRCCRAADFPVESALDCCSGRAELGRCICKTLGQPCGVDQECCSGDCNAGNCVGIL